MTQPQAFANLQGISTNVQDKRYPLEGYEVMIGRGTACQIQLRDPKVSRQHARIRFNRGVITIEDLKSSQGTLVNGRRVSSAELRDGDELMLGDTQFRFESTPDAVATMMADELGQEGMIACRRCGEKAPSHVRFCAQCGEPLHAPIPQAHPTPALEPMPPAPVIPSPVPQSTPPPFVPVGTDKVSGRRWLPFLLGLGVPVVLGIVVVLALVVLGVFDEPTEFPVLDQGQAVSTELPTEEVIVASLEATPFTFRAYNPTTDIGLPTQNDLAIYDDSADDDKYLYSFPMVVGQEVILDNFYCGTSENILDDIAKSINITFEIDGAAIPHEDLHMEKVLMDTRACYIYRGIFTGWVPGEHDLVQTMSAQKEINDGWETWGPEDLVMDVLIRVESEVPATTEPD